MYRVPAVGIGSAVAVTGFYAARLAWLAGGLMFVGALLVALAGVRERTILAHAEPMERERVVRVRHTRPDRTGPGRAR